MDSCEGRNDGKYIFLSPAMGIFLEKIFAFKVFTEYN
jgi:hypothetical protein